VLRIDYFIDHLKVGGAQRHLVELFGSLDRRRFALQVTVAKRGGALEAAVERLGIPVRPFGVGTSLARPGTAARLLATARRLRAERVHVVHGYLYAGNLLGMLAGRLAGVPIRLASKRSLDRYPRRSQLLATRLANACAHRVLCNAGSVARFVGTEERPEAAKLVVIPNGIRIPQPPPAAERPAGLPPGAKVVGLVGRLGWKKGYPDLLAAAVRVRAARPDVEFVVVGDGPLRGEITAQAARLGLTPHLHLLGELDRVAPLLRGFDVFVIASVIEGMPNALLEALALERPVVATTVGGIPEIVAHGESGLLVPPSDPAAMAEAILRLLDDPTTAAAYGAAGRRTVEARYSLDAMAARFTALYEELATARGLAVPEPDAEAPPRLAEGRA
jgi:glycosyltransferase involved in cell wall biosynthesis